MKTGIAVAVWKDAAKAPWRAAEGLLRGARALMTVVSIAILIGGILLGGWLWLAALLAVIAAWGWAAAVIAYAKLQAHRTLQLHFAPAAAETPHVPPDPLGAVRSLLLNVRNDGAAPVHVRTHLLTHTVRGAGAIDYPQGDLVLRMQHPAAADHVIQAGLTSRIDLAYVWLEKGTFGFLRPTDELWGTLNFDPASGYVTCKVAVIDLESGDRRVLDLRLSMGTVDPAAVFVDGIYAP